MATSPLDAYFKGLKRNAGLTDVRRTASSGGGNVYDTKKEKSKIQQNYLDSLPAQSAFKGMPVSDTGSIRRNAQQDRIMDAKVLQEADVRNQYDQARGMGGDIGRSEIKKIGLNSPGGESIFNKMYKNENITFNELTSNIGGTIGEPAKMYSDSEYAQAENLVNQRGYTTDDMNANPDLKKIMENDPGMAAQASMNIDNMLGSEEMQIANQNRYDSLNREIEQKEQAKYQEMVEAGPNQYWGPNVKREDIEKQITNATKYGEPENLMALGQAQMGSDGVDNSSGLMAYLNTRNAMKTAGVSEEMMKDFDFGSKRARSDKMQRTFDKEHPKYKERADKAMAFRRMEKKGIQSVEAPEIQKAGMLANAGKTAGLHTDMLGYKAKGLASKGLKFAGRFGKGLTDDSYKEYAQEGGYMRPDGKQGYFLGGLALGAAGLGAVSKAYKSRAAERETGKSNEGGLLSSTFGGLKKRYYDDPQSAGKLESIMSSTDSDGNAIGMEEAKKIRDAGGGSADLATNLGRGLSEFGSDSVEGAKTGIGLTAAGIVGGVKGIGTGLQAGYEGLTKNKASYEDLASGKEKGSWMQRLGKGMSFAGNVVDGLNEDIPFSSMNASNVKFHTGKDGDKVPVKDSDGYINKAVPSKGDELEDVTKDQVSEDVVAGKVGEDGVDVEGIDGPIIPAAILDKVKSMDDLKNLSPEQLMTIQKSLGGINVDGKFGPETMGAMQKYFDTHNRPPVKQHTENGLPVDYGTKGPTSEEIEKKSLVNGPGFAFQEGGFITELMNQRRAN